MISVFYQGFKPCCRYPALSNKIRHIERFCGNKSVYIVFKKLHMFGNKHTFRAICSTTHKLRQICQNIWHWYARRAARRATRRALRSLLESVLNIYV